MAKRKYVKKPKVYNDGLVDLRDVKIDPSLPAEERMISFIKQIKNPYRYRVGDIIVNVGFLDNGRSLKYALAAVIKFENR